MLKYLRGLLSAKYNITEADNGKSVLLKNGFNWNESKGYGYFPVDHWYGCY